MIIVKVDTETVVLAAQTRVDAARGTFSRAVFSSQYVRKNVLTRTQRRFVYNPACFMKVSW